MHHASDTVHIAEGLRGIVTAWWRRAIEPH